MNDSRGFQLADSSWSSYYKVGDTFINIDPLGSEDKVKLVSNDNTSCPLFSLIGGTTIHLPWSCLKTTYPFPIGAEVVMIEDRSECVVYGYTRIEGRDEPVLQSKFGYVMSVYRESCKLKGDGNEL